MLSGKEVQTTRFETNADEIMKAGAMAIGKMMHDRPALTLLKDKLTDLVAMTAFAWTINMQKKED